MARFRYIDGMIHTGMVSGVEILSKADARRICSHLISKDWDFAVRQYEGSTEIFVPESFDLDRLRKKFPDIKWSIIV